MTSRRVFLLGAAAVAGGVAIGYRALAPRDPETDLLPDSIDLEPGRIALTPYVVIDRSGITIIAPRAEMGQGIHTTLAALVAEELDVAFDAIKVEHGPASEHYANTFMFGPRPAPNRAHRRPSQATIAQTSIQDGFIKMRKAGAAARIMLVGAAARRLAVDPAALSTRDGVVVGADAAISYGELAAEAAALEPPSDPPLKPPAEWRLLGTSLPRVDMVEKCTGKAVFGIDVRPPDLLYATVVRNPRLGGAMAGFDATAASAMRGVEQVVPLRDGAVVVATNTWYALEAARKIAFDWEAAPYPRSTAEHRARIAQAFDGEVHDRPVDEGDVEAALHDGAVLEGEYRVPYLSHAMMEPLNATALLRDGTLTIWVGSQAPTMARQIGSKLSGLPKEAVKVHTPYLGGGFGRRFEMDDVEAAVRAAMAIPGRPVQVTYSRKEDLTHDTYRPMAAARFRAGVAEGRPVALDLSLSAPSLFASGGKRRLAMTGEAEGGGRRTDVSITMGAREQPYEIPNHRVTAYRPDDLLPVGWWRSVGESQNCFFQESILDEIAHAAGADPLEMRLSLLTHGPSRRVLKTVGEMSNWGAALPEGHARGLAFALSSGAATAQVVEVRHAGGRVEILKAHFAVDVGTALDPRNIESQVQGALVFGLSAAVFGEITVTDGMVDQHNFDSYPLLRMGQAPEIAVQIHESGEAIYGVGEAATPTAAPALGNALFAATGRRVRELPFRKAFDFA